MVDAHDAMAYVPIDDPVESRRGRGDGPAIFGSPPPSPTPGSRFTTQLTPIDVAGVAYSNSPYRAYLPDHRGGPAVSSSARDRVPGVKEWLGGA